MLYRKGIDVLISLSWALGSQEATVHNKSEPKAKQISSQLSNQQILTYAGYIVNEMVHDENKKQSPRSWLSDPSCFSMTGYLQNVNSLLIQFLQAATSTVRERQHSYVTEHAKTVCIFLSHAFYDIAPIQNPP